MGNALRESRLLKKIHLYGLTEDAVVELFGGDKDWPSLRSLQLRRGKFHLAGFKKILPLLKPLSTFHTLDISYCNLGVGAARLLAKSLGHTAINSLYLSGNNITDEGLELILSSQNAKHLVQLRLGKCKLTDRGFDLLSQFLRKDDTQLKVLTVDLCQKSGIGITNTLTSATNHVEKYRRQKMVAKSISKASKLDEILLANCICWKGDEQEYLFRLLCDTSTVEAVCNSNHRLISLNGVLDSTRLCRALRMNGTNKDGNKKGATAANAIRQKLQTFYFKEEFDVRYFNDKLDVLLMPWLLDLAQIKSCSVSEVKSNGINNINAIYRLLRNCHVSEMFSFPGPKSVYTRLWEKDEEIKQLQEENGQLKREIEELRHASSSAYPSKRAKP